MKISLSEARKLALKIMEEAEERRRVYAEQEMEQFQELDDDECS